MLGWCIWLAVAKSFSFGIVHIWLKFFNSLLKEGTLRYLFMIDWCLFRVNIELHQLLQHLTIMKFWHSCWVAVIGLDNCSQVFGEVEKETPWIASCLCPMPITAMEVEIVLCHNPNISAHSASALCLSEFAFSNMHGNWKRCISSRHPPMMPVKEGGWSSKLLEIVWPLHSEASGLHKQRVRPSILWVLWPAVCGMQ